MGLERITLEDIYDGVAYRFWYLVEVCLSCSDEKLINLMASLDEVFREWGSQLAVFEFGRGKDSLEAGAGMWL